MCKKKLLLLLSVFCLHGLAAQPESPSTSERVISLYTQASQNLVRASYLRLSSLREQEYQNYKTTLVQQRSISEQPTETLETPMNLSGELTNLLNLQMTDLLSLETQWSALVEQSKTLSQDNKELMQLLDQARLTIAQLRWNLECALERITDAEEGAIALLDENAEIFQQARLAVANIANMQREMAKSRRGAVIGWTVGSVSFGVGTPLIVEGIRLDNQTMLWSGVGVVGVASLVWVAGHYFFNWW